MNRLELTAVILAGILAADKDEAGAPADSMKVKRAIKYVDLLQSAVRGEVAADYGFPS